MKRNALNKANPYLRDHRAFARRVRSLASSTAIETGEPVGKIEQQIIRLYAAQKRTVTA